MKTVVVAAIVLLMAGTLLAQPPQTSLRDAPTQWTPSAPAQVSDLKVKIVEGNEPFDKMRLLPNADRCYFIRSYIFERQDGNAPVLKKETICTKSSANNIQKTKKKGAGFVPLVW